MGDAAFQGFCLEGQVRHVVELIACHRIDHPKAIDPDVNDLAQFRIIFDFQDRQCRSVLTRSVFVSPDIAHLQVLRCAECRYGSEHAA